MSLSAELCLTSLSSDSGILTAKLSEMSNSGELDKSPMRFHMESGGEEKYPDDHSERTENDEEMKHSSLNRSNSVRARANIFQSMEEQRSKLKTDERQPMSRCKSLKVLIEIELKFKIFLFF